jgi:hypothetical protein
MHSVAGTNGTVTLDASGVTIRNNLFGRTKSFAWADVGGAAIQPGNWLTRPRLVVLSRAELVMAQSGVNIFERYAGGQAAEWLIVVPAGREHEFEALKSEINRRVASEVTAELFAPGVRVLVAWTDGQRYAGTLAAVEPNQMLVVFPNGAQHWVPRAQITSAS